MAGARHDLVEIQLRRQHAPGGVMTTRFADNVMPRCRDD
jgi:hypothetical protein